jgi:hypothetical protein
MGGVFAPTPDDWYNQIEALVLNGELRQSLGAVGHTKSLTRTSAEIGKLWVDLVGRVKVNPKFFKGQHVDHVSGSSVKKDGEIIAIEYFPDGILYHVRYPDCVSMFYEEELQESAHD